MATLGAVINAAVRTIDDVQEKVGVSRPSTALIEAVNEFGITLSLLEQTGRDEREKSISDLSHNNKWRSNMAETLSEELRIADSEQKYLELKTRAKEVFQTAPCPRWLPIVQQILSSQEEVSEGVPLEITFKGIFPSHGFVEEEGESVLTLGGYFWKLIERNGGELKFKASFAALNTEKSRALSTFRGWLVIPWKPSSISLSGLSTYHFLLLKDRKSNGS